MATATSTITTTTTTTATKLQHSCGSTIVVNIAVVELVVTGTATTAKVLLQPIGLPPLPQP